MAHLYVVTAEKPTAVKDSVAGNFTSPDDLNLLVVKSTRIDVYVATAEGLKALREIRIYGKIDKILLFRPKHEQKDLLFVLTEKKNAMILECRMNTASSSASASSNATSSDFDIVTRAYGNVQDRVARLSESGTIAIVDPLCRAIALRMYDGLLKVIPLERDTRELVAFNIRMEEPKVIDCTFLFTERQPTIAYVYEDQCGRHVKTAEINLRDKEFARGSWKQENVENESFKIIAVPPPLGGALTIGAETVVYHRGRPSTERDRDREQSFIAKAPPVLRFAPVVAYARLDAPRDLRGSSGRQTSVAALPGTRYLLGDLAGRLLMLFLDCERTADGAIVRDVKVELLGDITIPECVTYLDNGVVFIGSRFGDSQLVRLNADADADAGESVVQPLETFYNIAPIVDMCVADLERQEQAQLVTCSGMGKCGSLRLVRSGIGIHEHASIDMEGLKAVWALRVLSQPHTHAHHDVLALALVAQTRFLAVKSQDDVEEVELTGCVDNEQSFLVANAVHDQIVQLVPSGVRLVQRGSSQANIDSAWQSCTQLVATWTHPEGRNVSCGAANASQVVVAVGSELFYLEIGPRRLELLATTRLDYEVACIDVTPLGLGVNPSDADAASFSGDVEMGDAATSQKAAMCAIGLWTDISVQLRRLPSLDLLATEKLPGDVIPRSVLLARIDSPYLLVGLGDGSLFYYPLNDVPLHKIEPDAESQSLSIICSAERKKAILGTQPLTLRAFRPHATSTPPSGAISSHDPHPPARSSASNVNVFVCSDRPTVVYSNGKKLLFSNVNLREVTSVCTMDSAAYPGSLALATRSALMIGTIDEIQQLHVRTITLGESPRRIVHQASTSTFGVLTARIDMRNEEGLLVPPAWCASRQAASTSSSSKSSAPQKGGSSAGASIGANGGFVGEYDEIETSNLLVVDQNTFEVLHAHTFQPNEMALSITSVRLGAGTAASGPEYYVVGTAMVYPDEPEPKHGRIVVFEWQATSGKLVTVAEKELRNAPYDLAPFGGNLVAAVGSTVRLLEWTPEREFRLECAPSTAYVTALQLKVKGDFILVGDLMRSLTLLVHKPVENTLEEIAHDHQPNWMTAIEILDDDRFIGSENNGNLFTCTKQSAASEDDDTTELHETGVFHLGDQVNVFRRGTLIMQKAGERTLPVHDSVLFGTVHGAVGCVMQLSPAFFTILSQLQTNLARTIKSVGKIEHAMWRAFASERKTEPSCNYIDGDLIESFLDLSREEMTELVVGIKLDDSGEAKRDATVDDIVKIVEELSRLH